MEQTASFPRAEHIKYIDRCVEKKLAEKKKLRYAGTIATSPTERRMYKIRVERIQGHKSCELAVGFQVVERCIDSGSEAELAAILEDFLEKQFSV